MGHRRWMLFGAGAESMEGAMREHNALYDAWVEATNWRTECLDENNRLDRELDEASKRLAELEVSTRVPFSDAQIERIAKAHMGVLNPGANWEHADKQYHMNAIRAALAAGGLEPCAVPGDVALVPSDDEVEKLAQVLQTVYEEHHGYDKGSYVLSCFVAQARAAIAHLAKPQPIKCIFCAFKGDSLAALKEHSAQCAAHPLATRPEGLPTAEELRAAHMQYAQDYQAGKNDGSMCATDLALEYLRSWLRDPVGWELDVTAEEALRVYANGGKSIGGMHNTLDLCRSRIRPVFECKECAKKEAEIDRVRNWNVKLNTIVETVRVALEDRDNG